MALLNQANGLKIGSQTVEVAFVGTTQVYPKWLPALVGSRNTTASGAGSVSVLPPAGVQAGDYMVVTVNSTEATTVTTLPSGWDIIVNDRTLTTHGVFMVGRRAVAAPGVGAEPASCTLSIPTGTCSWVGHMQVWRNAMDVTPADVRTSKPSSTTVVDYPIGRVSYNGVWVAYAALRVSGASPFGGAPAGHTIMTENNSSNNRSASCYHARLTGTPAAITSPVTGGYSIINYMSLRYPIRNLAS